LSLINEDRPDLKAILSAATFAISSITGSDMDALIVETLTNKEKGRRGPTPDSTRNFPLQFFIEGLWITVIRYEGGLSASCKSGRGSGTLFRALKLLTPILPKGFLRTGPDQTIANFANRLRYARNPRAQFMNPRAWKTWRTECERAWVRAGAGRPRQSRT
jgi:hypothetical protein